MPEESQVASQPRRDANRPVFSVGAVLCESAQVMLGELYVQGGARRRFSSSYFPFRIPRIAVAALIQVPDTETDQEHTLTIRLRDPYERDLALGIRRPYPSHLTDAGPRPTHALEYHFDTRRAREPRTDAESMQLPFCANFVDVAIVSPGTYHFAFAIDEIELSQAPFVVAIQRLPGSCADAA